MHLNKYLVIASFLILILLVTLVDADQRDPLQTIDLNNRTAEEMIPIIKPILKDNDAITGSGYQLFIRTDTSTFAEVTRLLKEIDKAPRNLIISVRNDESIGSGETDFDLSGNYDIGEDGRVVLGDRPPIGEGARVTANKTERASTNDIKHTIRVLEGNEAYIVTGQERPYTNQTIIGNRYGVAVYDNVEYEDLTSGFYVRPILTGNGNVTLHINPHYRSANDENPGRRTRYWGVFDGSRYRSDHGSIDVQEADTVITAKLAQWVKIGGVDNDAKARESGVLSTSRKATDRQNTIYIKVEVE